MTTDQPEPDTIAPRFEVKVDPEEMIAALSRHFALRVAEIEERYSMQIVQLELVISQLTKQ